jgi:adenylosuccinate synthase
MTNAIAVIGANYGDEGKGAATHYLARRYNIFHNVRFNGGSQAGHTVQIFKGPRHVFHNYGSSSFLRSTTWHTKDMLINPVSIEQERRDLQEKGFTPSAIEVNPDCIVVSPWDIALNQFMELGRGGARHGSCGQGIGETVLRNLTESAPVLRAKDLHSPVEVNSFSSKMQSWYRKRVKEEIEKGTFQNLPLDIGVDEITSDGVMASASVWMLRYPMAFMTTAKVSNSGLTSAKPEGEHEGFIFEGAQGLLLDQNDLEHFPYLTRSNTGVQNVVDECVRSGLDLTDIYYVTRPYLTRHGAGPILKGIPCGDLWEQGSCKTNIHNSYQGTISYAHLDWFALQQRIKQDCAKARGFNPKVRLIITCADQLSNQDSYQFYYGSSIEELDPYDEDAFKGHVESKLGIECILVDGRKGSLI